MTRRQRTTGLPRNARRTETTAAATRRRVSFSDRQQHWIIIGAVVALLVAVIGIFVYRWYDDNYLRPGKVVVSVGEQDYSLGYYADRLIPFYQASGSSLTVAEQQLLTKLEEEGLTVALAEERGIELTRDDVTAAIAEDLGVEVGGSGSAFDSLYRQRLSTLGMSDGNYRKLTEASLADTRIRDQLRPEIGTTGETVMLRIVVVANQADADEIRSRIDGGEDMGTIAQTESLDITTRQEDGLLIEPPVLFPEAVQTAIADAGVGDLLEPVQVGDQFWVVQVERRDANGEFTEEQVDELLTLEMERLIDEARTRIPIERNMTNDDIRWAEQNAG